MLLQGTLGGDFDIFAANGESTAWVLLWKTRSRPIGVRVCPVAQFNFFSTALTRVSGKWLFSGRKTRDVSPEMMRPALHHHQDLPSLMTLMFLLVRHHLLDRQILDFHQVINLLRCRHVVVLQMKVPEDAFVRQNVNNAAESFTFCLSAQNRGILCSLTRVP